MFITKRWHWPRRKNIITFIIIVLILRVYWYTEVQEIELTTISSSVNNITIHCSSTSGEVTWENEFQEMLKKDFIGSDCEIPYVDPFSKKSSDYLKKLPDIICKDQDWVKCYHSQCKVVDEILSSINNIVCTYNDIVYVSDDVYYFGPSIHVKGKDAYTLVKSDHVKVICMSIDEDGSTADWTYYSTGLRHIVARQSPPGRENTINVLILMLDSVSRNEFIRKLPKTYEFLTKVLNATVFKGYNIVGEGTSAALFPILTGMAEHELPNAYLRECERKEGRGLDSLPFVFYKLRDDGYRTAYFEDMPWIGTFQTKFNGFFSQPTDHNLRPFFIEEALVNGRAWEKNIHDKLCVGDTPQYKLMLNVTDQFLQLDGKRFCITFISDITHDNSFLWVADTAILNFLQTLYKRHQFKDTLTLIMGDHGPKYGSLRDSLEGRLEERLPFMAVILPEKLKRERPDAQAVLETNANRWITPFDIHTTLLDALDLPQYINRYKVPGANIARGMSWLGFIPKTRTCWDAGIAPHWCTCFAWQNVSQNETVHQKVADALVRHINLLTKFVRSKCAVRTLTSIIWVKRQQVNKHILKEPPIKVMETENENFQVKIVMGPGRAVYEASITYIRKRKRFFVDAKYVSRVNAYGNEPSCIKGTRPHLNMFCYCIELLSTHLNTRIN